MNPFAVFLGVADRWGFTGWARGLVAALLAAAAAAALCGALWGAWRLFDWANDRQAVQRDVSKSNAEVSNAVVGADRKAGQAKAERDAAIANQQQQAEEKAHEARRNRRSALDDLK